MKSVWHACCSFMSVCFIFLEKWINIMQGFRAFRNPILTWDTCVIVWRWQYHDVCESLWPLLLHGEDCHWICYKIFIFHKSTKVIMKILQLFQQDDKWCHHDPNQVCTDYRVKELPNDVSHLTFQCKANCLHMCIAGHVELCRQRRAEVFCE